MTEKDRQLNDRFLKDLLVGFVKLHILHHANQSPIAGQGFRNELSRHGYEMLFGTLYPKFLHFPDLYALDKYP